MAQTSNAISYTDREFNLISKDLLSAIPNMTKEWTPSDETDPGIIYLKIAAMLGDMLSYNRDRAIDEMFPTSVVERQDAYRMFRALGYKMSWYRAATTQIKLIWKGSDKKDLIIPKYTVFRTNANSIFYTYTGNQTRVSPTSITQILETKLELVQGQPITPPIIATQKVVKPSQQWHSIYGYNVYVSDISQGTYIRIPDQKVAEGTIVLIDDKGYEWKETETLASIESGKYFELISNSTNNPYIKLAEAPSTLNITKFKLFYIVTDGAKGRVVANTMSSVPFTPTYIDTGIYGKYKENYENISISNSTSEGGYDYETSEEARDKFDVEGRSLQTLVTLSDFQSQLVKDASVDNCGVYDIENNGEVFADFICSGPATTTLINSTIDLTERFGGVKTNLWLQAIRIYKNTSLLFFGGEERGLNPGELGENYTLYKKTSDGAILLDNSYINIVVDETNNAKINLHFDPSEVGDFTSTDILWTEYKISRKENELGININKNVEFSKDEVLERTKKVLNSKKHISLDYFEHFNPYKITWKPVGEVVLNRSVDNYAAGEIMTKIHLILKEKLKDSSLKLNNIYDISTIKKTILQECTDVSDILNLGFETILPLNNIQGSDSIDERVQNITYTGTDTKNLSKRITMQFQTKGLPVEDTEASSFYYCLNTGLELPIKPGTLRLSINNGEILMQDSPVHYTNRGTVPIKNSGDTTEQAETRRKNCNYGELISNNSSLVKNKSFVLYDSIGNSVGEEAIEPRLGEICNIYFQLSYEAGVQEYPIKISFETDRDFIFSYGGFEDSKFFVSSKCLTYENVGDE